MASQDERSLVACAIVLWCDADVVSKYRDRVRLVGMHKRVWQNDNCVVDWETKER